MSKSSLRRRSLVAFSIFIFATAMAASIFSYIKDAEKNDGTPWPLRKILDLNASLGQGLLSEARVDRIKFPRPFQKARVNGDIGLTTPIDVENWRLEVEVSTNTGTAIVSKITLDDLHRLPKTEVVSQFKCIEGWSEVMSFAGVRFSDFLLHYNLGTKSGRPPDLKNHPTDLYRFVGLQTPDGSYYVSLDMRSLWNPEVLLAYIQNDEPLTPEHGAPLRLFVPNKYGVKSLKRIGKITFTDERPADFWGEQGYDWFVGL